MGFVIRRHGVKLLGVPSILANERKLLPCWIGGVTV